MSLVSRTLAYDPHAELRTQFPSWWVTTADFGPRMFSHIICWPEKTLIVDPAKFCGDRDWAVTHMVAHLSEHMHRLDRLTVQDCEVADYIAQVRLDRECDRLPGCGGQNRMAMVYPTEPETAA